MYKVSLNLIIIYIKHEFNCCYDILITIIFETIKHFLTRRFHKVNPQLELVLEPI